MKDGLVLNIQRMSTEDGPGLRTTVFFKGCTMACSWCHNPESIAFCKEHEWFDMRCMRCHTCEINCTEQAVCFEDDVHKIDAAKCVKCFKCSALCPTNALEPKGKEWSVDALFTEVTKDAAYFENGGGVTLSGGEVLAQAGFAAALLEKLHNAGIHTAVDTCGHVPFEAIEKVIAFTSLFLYDIKQMDDEKHKRHTGAGNKLLLSNFVKLADSIRQNGDTKLWVRTPLIPGATDEDKNIRAIAAFLEEKAGDVLDRWELLAFNNLCAAKYDRLNKKWAYEGVEKMSQKAMDNIADMVNEYKNLNSIVFVTGTASVEEGA